MNTKTQEHEFVIYRADEYGEFMYVRPVKESALRTFRRHSDDRENMNADARLEIKRLEAAALAEGFNGFSATTFSAVFSQTHAANNLHEDPSRYLQGTRLVEEVAE